MSLTEGLFQIGCHHDAIIVGDAEKREKAHPNCNAQIDWMHLKKRSHVRVEQIEIEKPRLTIKPDHHETTRPSHDHAAKDQ